MRTILSGNAAVARGVYEAGAEFAAAYPGTPSTEILEEIAAHYPEVYAEWSVNEKVAFEVAFGAALGGRRALAAMKHVGVNVAADALMTAAYTGVNAGMVLVSADDPGMHSSQNEQDNRLLARFAKIPLLEPADSQEAKDLAIRAFEVSEQFDTPVMLRMTTRVCHGRSVVTVGERQVVTPRPYVKSPRKYVMIPAYARVRHALVEGERRTRLEQFAEAFAGNRIEMGDPALGIVSSGVAYQYAREAFPQASFLKLGMPHPLPARLVRQFAAQVGRIVVVEELEPFLEEQLRALGLTVVGKELLPRTGELDPQMIRKALAGTGRTAQTAALPPVNLPQRPPVLCPGCPHRGLFHALRKVHATVAGDIGCYTLSVLPPLEMMDTCVCMGASIGIGQGLVRAADAKTAGHTVAVLGDSTFVHSGIPSLVNAVYNQADLTVIIADNRTTAMTGQQDHPGTGRTLGGAAVLALDFEAVARAVGVQHVATVDPLDIDATEQAVRAALAVEGPAVVIARRPCVFVDRNQFNGPVTVDPEACTRCRTCLRLGCPALSLGEHSVVVDTALCAGCELCADVCPQDAFIRPVAREKA
jgi:indolepyruvate ferredoxin oxidoreductase, alpha subunit